MKKFFRRLYYVSTPVLREKSDRHLLLESIPNKVWNPVFTIGVITFVCSMLFRGFLDSQIAVIPLALSTFILFSGVWILSENGTVVFDNQESNCYCVYKHLGYLQKIYTYPLTSIDKVLLETESNGKFSLQLLKDDGVVVKIAQSKTKKPLLSAATGISLFLKIPLEV